MNIFQYESKFNQIFMTLADLIILNLLYILCCIPIFTIGAAQSGLFTGIRVLLDPEDDSPVFRAFFKGFSNGFKTITIVNCILLVIMAILVVLLYGLLFLFLLDGSKMALILGAVALAFVYILHTISAPFHATFGCTVKQLLRNTLLISLAHPVQAILSGALVLLPIVILLVWPHIFLGGLVAFSALYYSVVYLLIFAMWKKPFQRLKDNFYAAAEAADPEVQSENILEEACEEEADEEATEEAQPL